MAQRRKRDWGEIQERKTAKGWRYYPRYRIPGMTERFTPGVGFTSRDAAAGWLRSERKYWEDLVEAGDASSWLPPKVRREAAERKAEQDSFTVADMIGQWLAHKSATSWEQSTRQTNERQLNLRVLEISGRAGEFRALPVAEVTRRDAAAWWEAVWQQYPDTVPTNNGAKKHLTAAFKWAARQDLIPASPIDLESRRAKVGQTMKRVDLPTVADLRAILDEVPERYKFPTVLALFHGLRTQEVLGLRRWQVKRSEDGSGWLVDLSDRKRVRAAVRLSVDGKQTMVDKGLKTEDSYRVVPVFDEFTALAEAHMRKFAEPGADGIVATTARGSRVMDTSWNTTLKRAAVRAVPVRVKAVNAERVKAGRPVLSEEEQESLKSRIEGIRKHDGRRFVATELLEVGMSPVAAGAFIGDKNPDVVREHYLRQTEAHTAEGLAKVSRRLAGE